MIRENNLKDFYNVHDVKSIMGVCKKNAYGLIAQLNKELQADGYITKRGVVSKKYFNKRVGIA